MPTLHDFRSAIRALRGAPVVSALAIACIGLGIGSVTTVYSTATAFRPLPQMRDAGELMLVAETPLSDRLQGTTVTPGTFSDLRTVPEFTGVAALSTWTANIAGFDVAERALGARVSAEFFQVARRSAALGRTFTADDVRSSSGWWSCRTGSGGAALALTPPSWARASRSTARGTWSWA